PGRDVPVGDDVSGHLGGDLLHPGRLRPLGLQRRLGLGLGLEPVLLLTRGPGRRGGGWLRPRLAGPALLPPPAAAPPALPLARLPVGRRGLARGPGRRRLAL